MYFTYVVIWFKLEGPAQNLPFFKNHYHYKTEITKFTVCENVKFSHRYSFAKFTPFKICVLNVIKSKLAIIISHKYELFTYAYIPAIQNRVSSFRFGDT